MIENFIQGWETNERVFFHKLFSNTSLYNVDQFRYTVLIILLD